MKTGVVEVEKESVSTFVAQVEEGDLGFQYILGKYRGIPFLERFHIFRNRTQRHFLEFRLERSNKLFFLCPNFRKSLIHKKERL